MDEEQEERIRARELLQGARDLLDKKGWTQGVMARDEKGAEVPFTSPEASCYCAFGALHVTRISRFGHDPSKAEHAKRYLLRAVPEGVPGTSPGLEEDPFAAIVFYNDRLLRSKKQALAWFDKAIALSEKETNL